MLNALKTLAQSSFLAAVTVIAPRCYHSNRSLSISDVFHPEMGSLLSPLALYYTIIFSNNQEGKWIYFICEVKFSLMKQKYSPFSEPQF